MVIGDRDAVDFYAVISLVDGVVRPLCSVATTDRALAFVHEFWWGLSGEGDGVAVAGGFEWWDGGRHGGDVSPSHWVVKKCGFWKLVLQLKLMFAREAVVAGSCSNDRRHAGREARFRVSSRVVVPGA